MAGVLKNMKISLIGGIIIIIYRSNILVLQNFLKVICHIYKYLSKFDFFSSNLPQNCKFEIWKLVTFKETTIKINQYYKEKS